MKKIIGITGGSGTGKSSVSRILKEKGAHVIDADLTARKVSEKGKPALFEIKNHFGDGVINADGSLNRKALGAVVFSDSSQLDILDKITHKYIKEDILNEIENSDKNLFVIDAALLHKGKLGDLCDLTIAVNADLDLRIKRIIMRDGITKEEAESRIGSQKSDEYYSSLCDYTIENNGDTDELKKQLNKIIDFLEIC